MQPELFHDGRVALYAGDSREVLRHLPDASIDACVTDPPYGIAFMGRKWDVDSAEQAAFAQGFWREVYRVLKPGGHVLAFSATRTQHRLTCAIEDAGFEIRDAIWDVVASDTFVQGFLASLSAEQRLAFARCVEESQFGGALAWIYASGFPKSHDVARAIDALDGLEMRRERALQFTAWLRGTGISSATINRLTGSNMASHYLTAGAQPEVATAAMFDCLRPHLPPVPEAIEALVAARTVESENLKRRRVVGHHEDPAHAAKWREAYDGSEAAAAKPITEAYSEAAKAWEGWGTALKPAFEPITVARKPLIGTVGENVRAHGAGALNIDGCRVAMSEADRAAIDGMGGFGKAGWSGAARNSLSDSLANKVEDGAAHALGRWPANIVHDGSAEVEASFAAFGESRSVAGGKSTGRNFGQEWGDGGSKDRPRTGHSDAGSASRFFFSAKADAEDRAGSKHPTVKPVDLMQWLVRLVCRPGGTVLDPFAGSGTTGEAALREGMRAVLVEREAEYRVDIARRLNLAFAGPAIRKAERVKARARPEAPAPLFGEG